MHNLYKPSIAGKATWILTLYLMFLSNVSYAQADATGVRVFTVEELQEDFSFWRNRMEQKHPLVYLYTSKAALDQCFDSLYQAINHPMTEIAFYKLMAPVSALVKDGHNAIIPSEHTIDQIRKNDCLFPLEIRVIERKLYVVQNLSSSEVPSTGVEVVSINNTSAESIFDRLLSVLHRDGNNLQLPYATLNQSFRFYYHAYFGFSETYTVAYRTRSGEDLQCIINGRNLDSIKQEKLTRYKLSANVSKPGFYLKIIDSINTAVMTIGTFDAKAIKNNYDTKFKKEISGYFKAIRKSGTPNLILDLRDNGGGNPNYVKFVLQHLLDEPFEQAKECRIVQGRGKDKFLERTRKIWYPWYGIGRFQPQKNNFKGNLLVLVNEGTFSAGVILASVIRKYNRAAFIGSETGGNPIIMAGYLTKTSWKLPNTKIQIAPGTLCTVYNELTLNTGRGLIPDHVVKMTPDDILSAQDSCLDYAFKLIRLRK